MQEARLMSMLTVYQGSRNYHRLVRWLRSEPGGVLLISAKEPVQRQEIAAALAAELDVPVSRIDLSQVVSPYTGETEKNLARILDAAEKSDGILLLDEGDALFGKRTDVGDSEDRYADTESNFLQQRLTCRSGFVLVARSGSTIPPELSRQACAIIKPPRARRPKH